jgi:hypothetical protein
MLAPASNVPDARESMEGGRNDRPSSEGIEEIEL